MCAAAVLLSYVVGLPEKNAYVALHGIRFLNEKCGCGSIFNDRFVTNFLQNVTVKEF